MTGGGGSTNFAGGASGVAGGRNDNAGGGNSVCGDEGSRLAGLRGRMAEVLGRNKRDSTGLNPDRQRGFVDQAVQSSRIETPSLEDMRAKQGAVVARFLTFAQRKSSLVVELYNAAFYKLKPNWDKIANFVYNDLCPTSELRSKVVDVQFHPVKMLIFLKFSDDFWRDRIVERLRSKEGVSWREYGVKVKGYSLDPGVKFFRILGASSETEAEDIKKTFLEVGIGEVIEIKRGFLDEKKIAGSFQRYLELEG